MLSNGNAMAYRSPCPPSSFWFGKPENATYKMAASLGLQRTAYNLLLAYCTLYDNNNNNARVSSFHVNLQYLCLMTLMKQYGNLYQIELLALQVMLGCNPRNTVRLRLAKQKRGGGHGLFASKISASTAIHSKLMTTVVGVSFVILHPQRDAAL